MNLQELKTKTIAKTAKLAYKAKDIAPTVGVVVGTVGLVAGTVMVMKAVPKAQEVLDDHEGFIDMINEAKKLEPEVYTDEDKKKDEVLAFVKTGAKLVKVYAPGVAMVSFSAAAIMGSHIVMKKRNLALVGAYKTLESSFKRYRKNVVAKHGEEEDRSFMHERYIDQEEVTVMKKGKEVTETKNVEKIKINEDESYARHFDTDNRNYHLNDPMSNYLFVKQSENYLRMKLYSDGFLFLNEVYKTLGFELTAAGQIVGWTVDFDDTTDFSLGYTFEPNQDLPTPLNHGNIHGIFLDIQPEGMIVDKI